MPAVTQATLVYDDGTSDTLDDMNVRITQFTEGPAGTLAMPAALPATTG